jgi:hypothetical protein
MGKGAEGEGAEVNDFDDYNVRLERLAERRRATKLDFALALLIEVLVAISVGGAIAMAVRILVQAVSQTTPVDSLIP